MTAAAPTYEIQWIPRAQLRAAPWNANVVDNATLQKIRTSIRTFGIVENLVVRPLPTVHDDISDIPVTQPPPPALQTYEVISGNHRLGIYDDERIDPVPCRSLDIDDGHARILAEALNRTRGTNDPDKYRQLIADAERLVGKDEITALLNETSDTIDKLLGRHTDPAPLPASWQGRYQVVVDVQDEQQQADLYERLREEGYECRVLSM